MKKPAIILIFLAVVFLTSCGGKAGQETPWMGIAPGSDLEAITERTEYYDIAVESEGLFELGLWEKNPDGDYRSAIQWGRVTAYHLLGTQFVMGEPVQIWGELYAGGVKPSSEELVMQPVLADIYLYRTDGSRELLLKGLPDTDASFLNAKIQCYVDQDKNCYFYSTDYPMIDGEHVCVETIRKVLPTGEVSYKNTLEPGFEVEDIRQMEDGSIYMLLKDAENAKMVLEGFDPDTGRLIPELQMELPYADLRLGDAGGVLMLAGYIGSGYGVESVDMEAGSVSPVLFFGGTSYGWHHDSQFRDFKVLEDGAMEFLWTGKGGKGCFREKLRMEKVEKIPIVLRGIYGADIWLSERVALFNQKSSDYHVIMEACGYDNEWEDFARLTSVQVGAGKGPDILCGDTLLHDYVGGMLEKGALEPLNSYMEASGVREEDYFPVVFAEWRQGDEIYGVTPKMELYYEEMDAEVLGSVETPDIEALADALLSWEGSAVYRKGFTSGEVLGSLLEGSEGLWGMVDWERGSCNFNTPLFAKLLEAARRYGYDAGRELAPEITYYRRLRFIFYYKDTEERVLTGTLFDDGCHAVSLPLYTMAVNANSANKEGAWEFIAFLLGEDAQYTEEGSVNVPVHKESFDKWLEREISFYTEYRYENGLGVSTPYTGVTVSQEKREEFKKAVEDARFLPIRTAPVLEIILDEAEGYFGGSKSAEEVGKVIQNRVQLYLDERK